MIGRADVVSIDRELLAALERSFAHHGGSDASIDVPELQKALGLRSEYLARRMLALFDRDRSGRIEKTEFLAGVRRLVLGDARDKLWFAFKVHDHNGDGVLELDELARMIGLGLAEDELPSGHEEAGRLARTLLRSADRSRDGRISFDELEAAIHAHPQVLDQIARSEARWVIRDDDLQRRAESPGRRALRFLENRGATAVVLGLWGVAHVALFAYAAFRYHQLGANGFVMIARGCGACLNFDGALILVPMMRRFLTWVRATPLVRAIPVDDAIGFHRLVGNTMFAFGLVHTAAHLSNYAFGGPVPRFELLVGTKAGLTGIALLCVFAVMWWFARAAVRRSGKFERFYFTHLLYVLWLALMLAHGPVFWMWAGVPILGFFVEQVLRLARRGFRTEVIAGHALRSGVTRLELRRPPGFAHRAGDYLFLRIPELAPHEWHPFTISSAPERPNLTVHVRSLGNWTSALRKLVEAKHASGSHDPLIAHVDGPYGTPSAHVFESRCAVLIGAGIGVTPFASILESLLMRAYAGDRPSALRKAHFFWLNKDAYSFEWFAALLARLETIDRQELLDIHIYMTAGRGHATSTALALAREILHAEQGRDVVTGLRAKTRMGHPDWDAELAPIARAAAPDRVDVYFCGPHGLARKLQATCARLGMTFREEKF